jgi:dinuclear metal center YbgI/SA1388 family protein
MIEEMSTLATVTAALEHIAPLRLAAEWDSVGLLVGSRREKIGRVLTCLTLSAAVVEEAISGDFGLVVTHHPLPFRPVARLTEATPTGALLLDLAGAGVAVWSSHTAWDSAAGGINDQLAAAAGLSAVSPMIPDPVTPLAGFGRMGLAPAGQSPVAFARQLAGRVGATGAQLAGDPRGEVGRVGIVCGSGAEGIPIARQDDCDTFVTGELKLHDAAHAVALGLRVVVLGHHASERFSMPVLASRLATAVPGLECRASDAERDPLVPLDSL